MSHTMHNPTDEELLTRLRKIEGQVRGLQRMIERDERCADVLTQIASVTKALQAVVLQLLDDHLSHCITDSGAGGADAEAKVAEVSAAIARLVCS